MTKWKLRLTDKGIAFYCQGKFRGEIYTDHEIPKKQKIRLGDFLVRIINSFIEDENE